MQFSWLKDVSPPFSLMRDFEPTHVLPGIAVLVAVVLGCSMGLSRNSMKSEDVASQPYSSPDFAGILQARYWMHVAGIHLWDGR